MYRTTDGQYRKYSEVQPKTDTSCVDSKIRRFAAYSERTKAPRSPDTNQLLQTAYSWATCEPFEADQPNIRR